MDLAYWQDLTRLSIGTTAVLAVPVNGPSAIADVAAPPVAALRVFPNPAAQEARLWLELRQVGVVRITLCDALGRSAQVLHDGQVAAGGRAFPIPVHALTPGTYLVRVESGGTVRTVRVIRTP
jgi:hypothetical protein